MGMEWCGRRGRARLGVILWLAALLLVLTYLDLEDTGQNEVVAVRVTERNEAAKEEDRMEAGAVVVAGVCSSEPPSSPLLTPPLGPGVETVLLPGDPPVQVCIPHKAVGPPSPDTTSPVQGSHAWGQFSRALAQLYPERTKALQVPFGGRDTGAVLGVLGRQSGVLTDLWRTGNHYSHSFHIVYTLPCRMEW